LINNQLSKNTKSKKYIGTKQSNKRKPKKTQKLMKAPTTEEKVNLLKLSNAHDQPTVAPYPPV